MKYDWELTKLKDFVNLNPRRSVRKGSIVPFIAMTELAAGVRDIPSRIDKEFGSGTKFVDGDTLFARITPCLENGKTALVSDLGSDVIGAGSTEFIVLSPKDLVIDKYFVYYLARLPELRTYAEKKMEGTSGRQRVSSQALGDFEFNLPPRDARRKIGQLLANLDDKIKQNTQMNQTLEKIAQRIFKSWFIDFDPVKANAEGLPFAGLSPDIQSLFPSEFVESEMGLIPKGWEVKNLESFVEYVSKGTTPTKSDLSSAKDGNKIHYLKVRDIDNSGLIRSNLDRIPESIHKSKLKRSILKRNDLIVSIAGTIGRVTVIPDRLNNSNCNQAVCFIRLPEESIYHNYVRLILTQKRTKEYFESSVVQGVQANISLAVIKNTSILDPKEQIIECWNNTISSIIERISVNNEQNIKLQNIRDRLLPKLLSGSIKINQKLDEAS
jgi:type I restriction enzyme S subunit